MSDDPTDREAAIRGLRHRLHDEIEISDDGRILEAPDGTRLVNGRLHEPDTWIDRRSRWGNPFKLDGDGGDYGRGESVRLYKGWFLGHVERDNWDPESLRGKDLGCWCVPWLCHGVIILNYLTETHEPDADQQTLTDGGRTADAHPAEGDARATGADGLVPRWMAERPAQSCRDCGKESLFRCYVCGLYNGEKQRTRLLCNSCRAKRNERLEQNATPATETDHAEGGDAR